MSHYVPLCLIFCLYPRGLSQRARGVVFPAALTPWCKAATRAAPTTGRPYDGPGGPMFLPPGLVPKGNGELAPGQGKHIGLPLRLRRAKAATRAAPTFDRRGPGRHIGLPIRWGVVTSVSLFLVCSLMVEMGYAGWQGGIGSANAGSLALLRSRITLPSLLRRR